MKWAGAVAAIALVAACGVVGQGRAPNESAVKGVPLMEVSVRGQASDVSFGWASVPGATRYEVVVVDEPGHAAWAWTGPQTSVTPPAHAPIPDRGAVTVAAFDDERPIGLSDPVEFSG